jgi:hypothetical protein
VANCSPTFLPPHDYAHKPFLIKGCIPVERCRGHSSNERQACMRRKENGAGGARVMNTNLGNAVTSSGRKRVARLNPIYTQKWTCVSLFFFHGMGKRELERNHCPTAAITYVKWYMCSAAVSFHPLLRPKTRNDKRRFIFTMVSSLPIFLV